MKIRLPGISGKVWLVAYGMVLAVAIGCGIVTRTSYTDFSASPDSLAELPYIYGTANTETVELSPEYAKESFLLDVDTLVETTPVVVSGVLQGNRSYGYRSFVSDVRLTGVYRGDNLSAEQIIQVFEPVSVRQLQGADIWKQEMPESYRAFTEHFGYSYDAAAPYVAEPTAPIYFTMGMMKPGQEYLFFLYPKAYPEVQERSDRLQEYIFQQSPYARLAISPDVATADVAALDLETEFISVRESQECSFMVNKAADIEQYKQTRAAILQRVGVVGAAAA